MNTKNKQTQNNRRQKTRRKQRPKGQGQNMLHTDRNYQEHELPEMRLTR